MRRQSRLPYILLLSLTGCVLSYFLSVLFAQGTFAVWRPLGTPAADADSIAGMDFSHPLDENRIDVYVQTAAGQVYHRSTASTEGWTAVPAPQIVSGIWHPCYELNHPEWDRTSYEYMDRLPEPVKDCGKIIFGWEVFRDEVLTVVLEDGSVWSYRRRTDPIALLAFAVGGPLGGAGIALIWTGIAQRKREKDA